MFDAENFLPIKERERGKVKWFDEKKGYGFIVPENGGKDIFFHYSVIKGKGFKTLDKGQIVEFESEESKGSIKATFVRMALL